MTLPEKIRDWPADAVEALVERVSIMCEGVDGAVGEVIKMAEERVRLEWVRRSEIACAKQCSMEQEER